MVIDPKSTVSVVKEAPIPTENNLDLSIKSREDGVFLCLNASCRRVNGFQFGSSLNGAFSGVGILETPIGIGIIEEEEPLPSPSTSPLGMSDAADNLVSIRGLLKTKSLTIFTGLKKRGLLVPVMEVLRRTFLP